MPAYLLIGFYYFRSRHISELHQTIFGANTNSVAYATKLIIYLFNNKKDRIFMFRSYLFVLSRLEVFVNVLSDNWR